jgi:zinc transport system substrate-binding protein
MPPRTPLYILPLALLLFIASSAPIAPAQDASGDGELSIVCADTLLADLARNVVGDLATVDSIMPAGACPSHFDLRPSDAGLVADADVVVQLGWEPWLDDLIAASGNTDVVRVRCSGLDEWNVPEGAKAYVDSLTTGLSMAFPEHAAAFMANATAYKAIIDAKAAEVEALAREGGLEGRAVVAMEWQVRFVEWLGCEVVATYGPPEGLSTQQALEVATAAENASMVVDNLQSGTDFGAEVAARSGASHVALTNYPGASPGSETYLDMLEANARALVAGGQEHDLRQGEVAELESRVEDLRFQAAALATAAVVCAVANVLMGAALVRSRARRE